MKGKKKMVLTVPLLVLALFFASCGSEGGTETGTTGGYYEAVQDVTPSFTPETGSASLSKVIETWESGNPLYEVFYILREFNPETDQGVIDTSNLYKTMWEGRNFFDNARGNCSPITEQTITPPFDFGNEATTYNCVYNGGDGTFSGGIKELDEDGNIVEIGEGEEILEETNTAVIKDGIFGFVWTDTDDGHHEYGTVQAGLDTSSGALSLDIAVWVDYSDEDDYCYRNDIDGNTETHEFTFRSIKGNKVEGSNYTTIVGKGVSQGEGEYFLLKMISGDVSDKYFCIGAEDGEAELKLQDAAGSDTVDENCVAYQEDVDALTAFTPDDLACGTSDFNPGGTDEAPEGSVLLNYE